MPRFPGLTRVESTANGTTQLVSVEGEIDLASVDKVRGAIERSLRQRPETLVLDLSEVSFCDSSGIHLVVATHGRATEQDTRFVVIRPTGQAWRSFEVCQVHRELRFVSSYDASASPEAPV